MLGERGGQGESVKVLFFEQIEILVCIKSFFFSGKNDGDYFLTDNVLEITNEGMHCQGIDVP